MSRASEKFETLLSTPKYPQWQYQKNRERMNQRKYLKN